MRGMLESRYAQAACIVLVLDSSGRHGIEALCGTNRLELARALAKRLQIDHTPEHADWLNVVAFKLSAMCGQLLHRRIPDLDTLRPKTEHSDWPGSTGWKPNPKLAPG